MAVVRAALIAMEDAVFERIVEQAFNRLPEKFQSAIDNVGIFIEEYPSEDLVRKLRLRSKHHLFGLYQGIPLTERGTWYGMSPVTPDRISLYKKNIESACRSDAETEQMIYDVLIHEIGHYFGMSEKEIRDAGY